MQGLSYQEYKIKKEKEYEALCKRCGACCGVSDGDPCRHLLKDEDGVYRCEIYENRRGLRKTISGKEFLCVPIRNIMSKSWAHSWNCPYKKLVKY